MTVSIDDLREQAKEVVCPCYFWELCNTLDEMTIDDLQAVIETPYYSHIVNGDDLSECTEYQAEQAETLRDQAREDGISELQYYQSSGENE